MLSWKLVSGASLVGWRTGTSSVSGAIVVFTLIPTDDANIFTNAERLFVDRVEGLIASRYL